MVLPGHPGTLQWEKTSIPSPARLGAAPYPLCFAEITNHLLDEVLGFAVGVGAASDWVVLIQGEVLGVSIDSGRAAEHNVPHAVGFHGLGSRDQPPLSQRAPCPPQATAPTMQAPLHPWDRAWGALQGPGC